MIEVLIAKTGHQITNGKEMLMIVVMLIAGRYLALFLALRGWSDEQAFSDTALCIAGCMLVSAFVVNRYLPVFTFRMVIAMPYQKVRYTSFMMVVRHNRQEQ